MASGHDPHAEAARLRYELARLRAKRSVRLALLMSRGGSPADVWRTLRGRRVVADLDVIPPWHVDHRAEYPHLVVATTGEHAPFGWVAAHLRVATPDDVRAAGADLLVLDLDGRQGPGALTALADAAGEVGTSIVGLVTTAADARAAQDAGVGLVVGVTPDGASLPGADLSVAPWVDGARANPVGWTPADAPYTTVAAEPVALTTEVLDQLARGRPVATSSSDTLPEDIREFVAAAEPQAAAVGERARIRASRHVLQHHEALARFESVLAALGIPRRAVPRISVLLATSRPDRLEHALHQVVGQDHPDLEVILLLHGDGFPADATSFLPPTGPPVHVRRQGRDRCLGDVLNAGLEMAGGEYIAKMDDDDHYGASHLSDLLVALRYSGADAVGRWANEVYVASQDVTLTQDLDRQERWAHHLPGATMLVRGDVLRQVRFRRVRSAVDTHLVRAIHAQGGTTYATHRFGFVRVRHGEGHTHVARDDRVGAVGTRPGLDLGGLQV